MGRQIALCASIHGFDATVYDLKPDKLAAGVTYRCTDDASWVTGQTIVASGGSLCL